MTASPPTVPPRRLSHSRALWALVAITVTF
ncbi:MAG: hypothetical protein QOG42_175, partial [Solirubrobacteraceae bacterium]|nr:hypothetical protein [Solirubrobacteraceae bacterium]